MNQRHWRSLFGQNQFGQGQFGQNQFGQNQFGQNQFRHHYPRQIVLWLILAIFAIVIVLEYSTPPAYLFGYLYTGAILLANHRLGRSAVFTVTIIAAFLTLLNLAVPGRSLVEWSTVANRVIAVLALTVTGWLSDRNRVNEEAIAQQQAQLQAQAQLSIMREDFVSTLTHDLRTPLLGAIETLKSFQAEQFGAVTAMQQKVLGMMLRSQRSLLDLVETVLDIYRNDAEGLQLNRSTVDLIALLEEVIATLTDLALSRRVYVQLSYGESEFRSALQMYGDSLQLRRVFTNLIANAINHTPRGSKVEVILEASGGNHCVVVMDNGSGIPLDELPHLFDRFYQGHSDRQTTGSGLGLYLSRQIIAAHGGIIKAANRSPQGAIFSCCLPSSSD